MKNTLKELIEIDRLLKEYKNRKSEYLEALRIGTRQEVLVMIENELEILQKEIYAKDRYTNPRRFINWN